MATKIRPKLSKKNQYWISKHRYYELKHFCLQYPEWRDACRENIRYENDPTGELAVIRAELRDRMAMVEDAAYETDRDLSIYILKAVTTDRTYTSLRTVDSIPCSRNVFYELYRRFFYILSHIRK